MRLSALPITGSLQLVLRGVLGGELHIEFPGFLRVRAESNLQTFSSALGGASAEPITSTTDERRPFAVGANTFTDYASAAVRTCNNQKNACVRIANGEDNPTGITISDCESQETECTGVASSVDPSTIGAAAPPAGTDPVVEPEPEPEPAPEPAPAPAVAPPSATLHSSDENFYYFCDP
ncbi:hypothetical protein BUE80_DR004159 [Diplocarpon rosae]|nr:hypothetical protein BUE80_DR004159 [Diplocarpon rosae]